MTTNVAASSASVRVRYAETDRMSVAYYANYFIWFEVGRSEFFRSFGSSYRELEALGLFLPVIEANCEYRKPARYDDKLSILTRGRLVSPVRIRFDYEIKLSDKTVVTAVGRTVHAAVDGNGQPTRLPTKIQQVVK